MEHRLLKTALCDYLNDDMVGYHDFATLSPQKIPIPKPTLQREGAQKGKPPRAKKRGFTKIKPKPPQFYHL
ncbi:hypothetical protein [Helicobacter macacae]|uniref:hypothetical protein n=1 Tax=Helicobacter macacae TaxID=398626 RepID=UPI0003F9B637|nr:hypothetical protein [Helicobacter macacae]